ncbi:MAG: ABC transporter ATP-binding protein [Oscillospiraceae bacterium]|nr:ABC transporter ATP-binding protein [Oscillospiraceae bacterium]
MIQVSGLTKHYGRHLAVDDISFTVKDGEILGFLGPNGAGKSTTMNIMTGYLSATRGDVTIDGFDILREPEKAKRRIGYLPDVPPIYGDMLVSEYLSFVCDIKGVKRSERAAQLKGVAEAVKIADVYNRLCKNLSKGYKQRVGLAQALLGRPAVLVLDEPTSGLDPKQIIEMRDVIRRLGKKHTVILSSHILSEVSAVCDRIMIINKGRVVAIDTPERLSAGFGKKDKLLVRVKGSKNEALSVMNGIPSVRGARAEAVREPGTVDILVEAKPESETGPQSDMREALFYACAQNNLPILMLSSQDLTLEEIFLQVTDVSEVRAPRRGAPKKAARAPKETQRAAPETGESTGEEGQ